MHALNDTESLKKTYCYKQPFHINVVSHIIVEYRIKTYKVKPLSLLRYIEALSFNTIAVCFLHITNENACTCN